MTILKSLVAAPLLICGAAICSPVSAETVVNNDMTSIVSAKVKEELKRAEAGKVSKPLVIIHRINMEKIHRIGCEGGVEYGCPKQRFQFD